MGKINIGDIASLAGVSKATVSRAIHSPHMVKSKTLESIRQIMKRHNYVYDALAGDLSRRRTSVIGLIIPTIKSSIFAESTYGIEAKARKHGYSIILGHSHYDQQTALDLMTFFRERRVAGLILTGLTEKERKLAIDITKSGTPCVVTWETLQDSAISFVGFDNLKASYSITNYLISLRHKRIGLIVGPYRKVDRVRQRLAGYQKALAEHNISFNRNLVVETEYSLLEGREAARVLLSLPNPPSAIFAASDVLAMGALAMIREKGLKVPQDISVAGFDDIDFASCCTPPLTTVKVPAYEMGTKAMKVMLDLMGQDTAQVRQYCLDTDLIIRDSCQAHR